MMTQAEEGMKLFKAEQGTAAEVDQAETVPATVPATGAETGVTAMAAIGKTWENHREMRECSE